MAAPVLRTLRAVLRPLGVADLDAIHALWTDPDVRRYLWDDVTITRERAAGVVAASADNFRSRGYGIWGIRADDGGPLMGFSGAIPAEDGGAELIYGLLPAWWGRGLATECAGAVLDHLFDTAGQSGVLALTDAPNAASVRLMERLGMTFERRGVHHGLDTVFYRLSADAWRARRVVIRLARSADEPLLRSLTPRLADFPRPPWRTAHEIDVSDHRYLFDALHHPREDALVLVAERPAGHGVGMVFVTTQIDYFTHLPHPHVETLAVDVTRAGRRRRPGAARRRRGLGGRPRLRLHHPDRLRGQPPRPRPLRAPRLPARDDQLSPAAHRSARPRRGSAGAGRTGRASVACPPITTRSGRSCRR